MFILLVYILRYITNTTQKKMGTRCWWTHFNHFGSRELFPLPTRF